MKKCYTCKKNKPIEDFIKASHLVDGRTSQCKDCRRKNSKKNSVRQKDNYHSFFNTFIG